MLYAALLQLEDLKLCVVGNCILDDNVVHNAQVRERLASDWGVAVLR